MKIFSAIFLCLPTLLACKLNASFDGEKRHVEHFSELEVRNGIDVYLTQGETENLRIEVRGYDLDDIVTEVTDGRLHIYRRKSLPGSGSVKVYLNFINLNHIEASGGSDIESLNRVAFEELYVKASGGSDLKLDLDAYFLDFSVSGGSDIAARGSVNTLKGEASGGSDIEAKDLIALRGILRLSGGSDAIVFVREEIEINASGGSDAVVYGNPGIKNLHNDRSSDVAWE